MSGTEAIPRSGLNLNTECQIDKNKLNNSHEKRSGKHRATERWAVTMAKVRIRRVASRTRWQLVTFYGKSGAESVDVVDMLAIRKAAGIARGQPR